jgi:putative aldouronate transport system substrate-binding protein
MKKKLVWALISIMVLSLSVNVMAGGGRQSSPQVKYLVPTTPAGTVTVKPSYGDAVEYPQPATSYTKNPAYPQQPEISNPNGFPITKEKVNLRVAAPAHAYVTDFDNNDLTKFMEELTNVHVIWELLPQYDYMEKINLMFNSGGDDLPDVFLSCYFQSPMLISLGSAGLILPLQNLIEKNTYNHKRLAQQKPSLMPSLLSADGNIYTMGQFSQNEPNQFAMRFWINKAFLDALGMKMPTTTDEYYNYLKAVKTGDPNKNGKADEIPLVGATEGWHAEIDGFLMNAFAFNETSTELDPARRRRVFVSPSGKVEASFVTPGWKKGLEYLHKLYAEGLLAPESFTLKKEEYRALVENADASIVGSLPSGGPHEFANNSGTRKRDFVILPPLKGPDGIQQIWYDQYYGPTIGNFVITKNCKIPEIAVKWADYQYTEDFRMRNRWGVLGRDWTIPPAGTKSVDGSNAIYQEILPWGTPQNAYWGMVGLVWSRWGGYKRAMNDDPWDLELVLYNAYKQYEPYGFNRSLPFNLAWTLEEARQYTELNRVIVEYVEQSLARFVTGELDLNRDWDRYIADLNKLGLPNLLKLYQTVYDRQWKNSLGY